MTTKDIYERKHHEENQWLEAGARNVKVAEGNDREYSKGFWLGTTYLVAVPFLIAADFAVARHAIAIPLLNSDGILADEWWWPTMFAALQVAGMLMIFKLALDHGGRKTRGVMLIAGVFFATLTLLGLAGTSFGYEYIDTLPEETLAATAFSFDPTQALQKAVSPTDKVRTAIELFVQPIAMGLSKLSLVALPLVAALLIDAGLPRVQAARAARRQLVEANDNYEQLVSHLEEQEHFETVEAEQYSDEAKRRRRYQKTVAVTEDRASNHESMVDALIAAELTRNPNS